MQPSLGPLSWQDGAGRASSASATDASAPLLHSTAAHKKNVMQDGYQKNVAAAAEQSWFVVTLINKVMPLSVPLWQQAVQAGLPPIMQAERAAQALHCEHCKWL